MSGILYLERLSPPDLALLAEAGGEPGTTAERVARLRSDPGRIEALVASPAVFDALFGRGRREPVVLTAPFLAFAVLVAGTYRLLGEVSFVREWVGPERRVPVFDVVTLREFLDDPLRRFFLSDLLASYTHVASGSVWVRTARGWRRRRFSELDPLRFAELVEAVPEPERVALYRRLGDVALFLSGVFPDYAGRRLLTPVAVGRLKRVVGGSPPDGRGEEGPEGTGLELLEWLGRRSYRLAWEATHPRDVGLARVIGEVADRFAHARRILNFLTEQYLFPYRERWLPGRG